MRQISGTELKRLTFGEEIKIVITDGKKEEKYGVIFGGNIGYRDGSVAHTMVIAERERRGECQIFLMSDEVIPMDSIPKTYNVEFEMDNGAVILLTNAICIAGSPEMASSKVRQKVNSLDSETYCHAIHSVEEIGDDIILFHH